MILPFVSHRPMAMALLLLLPLLASAAEHDRIWREHLKNAYFGERPVVEGSEIISLDAPYRAEDAAIVPIRLNAGIEQTPERYIKSVHLFVDNNPAPLAGRFEFTPNSGRADLALRVRVNAYTPIRAVAELNDGSLHMTSEFVKASGGCSAPASGDYEAALTRMGKMKLRLLDPKPDKPVLTQLNISHPNVTGLQMDQLTRLYRPAHFVQTVVVTFAGEQVLKAETDISISEDPSFRFFFVPSESGELTVEATDNQGQHFRQVQQITIDAKT